MTLEAWVNPAALGGAWRTALLKEHGGTLAYALYAHDGAAGPGRARQPGQRHGRRRGAGAPAQHVEPRRR